MPAPTPDVSAAPFSAAGFAIRPMRTSDAGPLIHFGGSPSVHYVCFGSDTYRREQNPAEGSAAEVTIAAVVAVARNGEIVGMARLAALPGSSDSAELTVATHGGYLRMGLLSPLLQAIAEAARACGIRQLVTSLECRGCDPFSDFRGAGLRAQSWLGIGGVTELVLAVE